MWTGMEVRHIRMDSFDMLIEVFSVGELGEAQETLCHQLVNRFLWEGDPGDGGCWGQTRILLLIGVALMPNRIWRCVCIWWRLTIFPFSKSYFLCLMCQKDMVAHELLTLGSELMTIGAGKGLPLLKGHRPMVCGMPILPLFIFQLLVGGGRICEYL